LFPDGNFEHNATAKQGIFVGHMGMHGSNVFMFDNDSILSGVCMSVPIQPKTNTYFIFYKTKSNLNNICVCVLKSI